MVRLLDHHQAAVSARNRSFDKQNVPVQVNLDDFETLLGHALTAHAPGTLWCL